jgi:WD40 repeat protein
MSDPTPRADSPSEQSETLASTLSSEAASPPAPEGVRIPGYEVLATLGRGGMGVVYQARQTKLGRAVALKMILAGAHAAEADLKRFRTEAEAIARLQHPNIIQIYEVGEHGGLPFFSLEFCPAGSLEKKLNGTPLAPAEAAALVEALARAMEAAHKKGVVHRDLKPANILLQISDLKSEIPKITDFGLAKRLDEASQTASGALVGTPSYMAPEQAGGRSGAVGPLSDVYSLGAILYECVTGRPPFKAATQVDTLMQVVHDDPAPPASLNPRVPRDLETVCLKCLQKEPARRYASAGELANDLRRFLDGEPVRARPVGPGGRLVKWARRRPAVAALSALLLAVVVGAFATVLAALHQANEQRKRADEQRRQAEERQEQLRVANEDLTREQLGRQVAQESAWKLAKQAVAAQNEAERNGYFNGIGLAAELARDGDLGRAREVLAGCPAPYRSWEWDYLNRLCRGGRLALPDQAGAVAALAFSPDGKYVAVGSGGYLAQAAGKEGSVTLFQADDGRQVFRVAQPGGTASRSVAFSPDGTHLALLEGQAAVRVYRVPGGEPAHAFTPQGGALIGLGYTRAGRLFAASYTHQSGPEGNKSTLVVWDVGDEKEMARFHGFTPFKGEAIEVVSVAFSPDGRRVAALGANEGIRMASASSPAPVEQAVPIDPRPAPAAPPEKSGKPPPAPANSEPTAESGAGQVKVWDLEEKRLERTFTAMSSLFASLAFSGDGRRLAWGEGLAVAELDLTAPAAPRKFLGHRLDVHAVAYGPDGRFLVSTSDDKTIRFWEVASGRELFALRGHSDAVIRLACSPDGKRLASGTGNLFSRTAEVKLWDAADPVADTRRAAPGAMTFYVLSPDGRRAALSTVPLDFGATQPATQLLDTAAKGAPVPLQSPNLHMPPLPGAFSADGSLYAVYVRGNPDWSAVIFDTRTGKVRTNIPLPKQDGPGNELPSLAFDPDARRLALVWVAGARPGGKPAEPKVCAHVLDVESGKVLREFNQPIFGGTPVGWERDAGYLVLATAYHGRLAAAVVRLSLADPNVSRSEVVIWDPETGEYVRTHALDTVVAGLAFDRAGGQLVATGGDAREGRAVVWDVASGKEVLALRGHSRRIIAATFGADGKRLVTAGGDGLVKFWDFPSGREVLTLGGHARPVTAVAFTPDGRRLVSATGLEMLEMVYMAGGVRGSLKVPAEIKVWDAGTSP